MYKFPHFMIINMKFSEIGQVMLHFSLRHRGHNTKRTEKPGKDLSKHIKYLCCMAYFGDTINILLVGR